MDKALSREGVRETDKMVQRVARKAGYTGADGMTYKQIVQAKFEQKREEASRNRKKSKPISGTG